MNLSKFFKNQFFGMFKDRIVEELINLPFPHDVCKSCLTNESDNIECKICGKKQTIDGNINIFIKKLIEMNLPELLDILENRMSDELRKLKSNSVLI